nr:retrovirus-related Pol polyprotein from transposon TNT 1-94 [Tanacetum cinerariifolium]
MSNVSNPQHHSPSSSTSSSTQVPQHLADNPHLDSSLSPMENLIENLTNTPALLRTSSNTRNQATVQDGRVVVQNVQGRQNRGQGINPQGGGAAGYGGVQNRVGNANPGQARQVKCYNCNGTWHISRNCTQPKRPQNSEYYKDKMLLMQAQENGVALDAKQLLFLAGGQDNAFDDDVDEQPVQDLALNVDNVFQADDCDAFDSDMDEAPTAQTMFMANLSSADPVTDEAGPSYYSDILSEYVKDNEVPVVHSDVSSVPNDAFMLIYNDMNNRDAHLDYLRHLKESDKTIRDIVEEAKVVRPSDRSIISACRYTKHFQELLEYAIGTCSQDSLQRDKQLAHIPLIWKKQVTFAKPSDKSNSNTHKHVATMNTQKTNVTVPPSTRVNSCPNASGSQPGSNTKKNRISPAKGVNKLPLDSGMTNLVLSWIMEIMLLVTVSSPGKHSCYVRDTDAVELIKGSRGSNLYTISIEDMMKSSPICLLSKASKNKSWLWHRRLNHLNFVTINDLARKDLVRGLPRLKFEKDHLCFTCQLGKSKKHTHKPKTENTNLEVLHTLHMDLCVKILENFNQQLIFRIFVGYAPSRKGTGPAPNFLTHRQISSGLVPNPVPATPYVPPTNKDLEILFQPMFDEYLKPPRVERPVHPDQAVQAPVNSAAEPTYMEDHHVAPVDNNPFVNVFAPEPHSKASSPRDISSTESTYVSQTLHH